mgnify:FL=1
MYFIGTFPTSHSKVAIAQLGFDANEEILAGIAIVERPYSRLHFPRIAKSVNRCLRLDTPFSITRFEEVVCTVERL